MSELRVAPSATRLTTAAILQALETAAMAAALDELYSADPQTRPTADAGDVLLWAEGLASGLGVAS